MVNLLRKEELSGQQKLDLMRKDARFDVADDQDSDTLCIPDLSITDSIRSLKNVPKVPKVFLSNNCKFNCAYCGCRCSRDSASRYCNEPRELAELAVADAIRNRRGVFITSAIHKNADYTEELIIETLRIMREDFEYHGYIHAKIMPGTDPILIEKAGTYADRLSINIEVAKSEGYDRIAKQKNRRNILEPMRQISSLINSAKQQRRKFAVSQSTQLMAGSTNESDRTILVLSDALYRKYKLSRVYYSAFQYKNPAAGYDLPLTSTPSWRTRRLYQADRLMKLYGFHPDELAPETAPDLCASVDPKIACALRNIENYPIEVNRADFKQLLHIPGIGIVYAKKIMEARKHTIITHDILQKMGISLRKSLYFILCNGKYLGGNTINRPDLLYPLFQDDISQPRQLTFF